MRFTTWCWNIGISGVAAPYNVSDVRDGIWLSHPAAREIKRESRTNAHLTFHS